MQVVSPVPEPAASSHISAGGLEPDSCLPADLANTTQEDLAVLELGMIWTGVTQFRLCRNIEYAQYTLQCMLVGCMGIACSHDVKNSTSVGAVGYLGLALYGLASSSVVS